MTRPPARWRLLVAVLLLLAAGHACAAGAGKPLQLMDVFRLEFADDPQVSPDSKRIVYVRNFMDVKKDRQRSNLWIVNTDGTGHQAMTTGDRRDVWPRWSPDGKRLLYVSDADGSAQLYCLWLDTGRSARLTRLPAGPVGPAWSPDGKRIAFAMHVAEKKPPFVELPKPDGAERAPAFKMTRELTYRFDGRGYLPDGHVHVFVVPAEGGEPRQLTEGPYNHGGVLGAVEGPAWTADGKALVFSANRHAGGEHNPLDTEIFEVSLADRRVKALTDRRGPDHSPTVSPDGKLIAYLGFDDRKQGHQTTRLYVMDRDGKNSRALTAKFDRDARSPRWASDGKGVCFLYDDEGETKVGLVSLDGELKVMARDVGGTTLGRPYSSGSFSVAAGTVAFTLTSPTRPADLAVVARGKEKPTRLTRLNQSLLGDRTLGAVEEVWYTSSHDRRKIQGWIVKPPGFDPKKKYPLILEIHGGPFANYGRRFSVEHQLYAAAGYVVFFANPRGSTGYGEEFGNLIHHAYPGHDHDDLMSGVDMMLKQGYIDANNLFVTGGSGGGVLTCWAVGKTDRFRAAVATYPVINWHSFVLNSDLSAFFVRHWFPGPPWQHAEHYRKRSPLSLVGAVKTPTMLITGEADHRTPISEAEQYYKALKLRKVDAALVRVPGASHNVSARPSQGMTKVAYILKWFETHRARRGEKGKGP